MMNKKKFAFLTAILSLAMVLGACGTANNKTVSSSEAPTTSQNVSSSDDATSSEAGSSSSQPNSSSVAPLSSQSDSSSEEVTKYTVQFKVDGQVVETIEVEEGELATFSGNTPTKEGSIFKCWDPDISAPITANTVFNAVFMEYSDEMIIDDFSRYDDTPSMLDANWVAIGYKNNQWVEETAAAVSLGYKSEEVDGKSLRFDAWANTNDYKFAKKFAPNTFTKSANALRFRLSVPTYMTCKVLLHAKMNIAGTEQTPYFTYTLNNRRSNEFVEYTIPLNDPGWALWNEEGKSISTCAEWMGVKEDALLAYLTRIEFYFKGNDGVGGKFVSYLDSAKFVTLDNPTFSTDELIKVPKVLTGLTKSGYTLKVDVDLANDSTATLIDMETPLSVTGKITFEDNNLSFVSNDNGKSLTYNAIITDGGKTVKYVSASGTFADEVEDMDMVAVQKVDDYEQYTEDGQAYYQDGPYEDRYGCRGDFYSEYYSNNEADSSPWGGLKWSLMGGSGDQLKLKQDAEGAHSGSNYLCMKNSSSLGMRYMQMGLFDGTSEKNSFRGNKMGFWAKTNGVVKKFTVYAYYQNAPTNQTRDERVSKAVFTETAAIGEWKHYEMDLNPTKTYYGYMFFIDANWASDSFLYIDDIEIYGASPYATYVAPTPFALDIGAKYTAKINGLYQAFLDIKSSTEVTINVPGVEGMNVNGTYVIDDETKDVTISLDGGVTYVVTGSTENDTLAFKSVTGGGLIGFALDGVSFNRLNHYEDAERYADSGKMYYQGNANENDRSGARGAYYCDYYSGSGSSPVGGNGWSLMGGSGDQLSLDKEVYYQGNQSIKLKRSSVTMRYMEWDLYKGTAKPITGVSEFSIFLKNQAADDTVVRILVFTEQLITPSNQTTARINQEVTMEANQDWTKYTVSLDPTKTYYGFGIILPNDSSVGYVNFDNAMFSSVDNNPVLKYYAKKDMVLSGTITAGEASIKFGEGDKAYLTCAALGADNTEVKYGMAMNGSIQEMTITTGENRIIGNYAVDASGKSTFTVTAVSEALAAAINVGAVLASNAA